MLGTVLLISVCAAPSEDAAKALRVAWASQYEWRESDVATMTIDFTYAYVWTSTEGVETREEAGGTIVVAGHELVRVHAPGVSRTRLDRIRAHLDWVVARFARERFEDEFKDVKFGPAETLADGLLKVPAGKRTFLLKDDRIVGEEIDVGTKAKPFVTRLDYETVKLVDGYTIRGETLSYTRGAVKTTHTRSLAFRGKDAVPAPKSYVYAQDSGGFKTKVTLSFGLPKPNVGEAVVLDPAARDVLKAAWANRYTLPDKIRINGDFQRKLDKHLARAGWTSSVRGSFQVWGIDQVEVQIDENSARGWSAGRMVETCTEHFRRFFGRMRATPFEVEFAGCGFVSEGEDKGVHTIRVVGYHGALGFRVEDGDIVGHHDNVAHGEAWWDYRLKRSKDDRAVLDRMTRKIDGSLWTMRYKYSKSKGELIPRRFDVFVGPDRVTTNGIATYELKKLQAESPDR